MVVQQEIGQKSFNIEGLGTLGINEMTVQKASRVKERLDST